MLLLGLFREKQSSQSQPVKHIVFHYVSSILQYVFSFLRFKFFSISFCDCISVDNNPLRLRLDFHVIMKALCLQSVSRAFLNCFEVTSPSILVLRSLTPSPGNLFFIGSNLKFASIPSVLYLAQVVCPVARGHLM